MNVSCKSELEGVYSMKSRHYDIVRKENNKSTIWLEAAPNLNVAESRIEELASFWPGEFQIMDQQNHRVLESIVSREPHQRQKVECSGTNTQPRKR
jgi:hypothetical protein